MEVCYAIQVCDISNNQIDDRYCKTDRTTLSIKSITSLIDSILYVRNKEPGVKHKLVFVDDRSTKKLKKYLSFIQKKYSDNCVEILIVETKTPGLMPSVRYCYEWLISNGTNLVYQIQDDYLFYKTAIYEMIDMFFQLKKECNTDAIISPWNDCWLWLSPYRNKVTPRGVFVGKHRYWISYYDMSCSFMTSVDIYKQNWDLLNEFCNMPPLGDKDHNLENITLNKMLTQRGILGIIPINSLALHVQSELEKDPYIDWKKWWDDVSIVDFVDL